MAESPVSVGCHPPGWGFRRDHLGALGWAYHDARPERLTPPGHHPQARPRPLAAEELITVFAEDLAETKAFYDKILGLEVLGEETNERSRPSRAIARGQPVRELRRSGRAHLGDRLRHRLTNVAVLGDAGRVS